MRKYIVFSLAIVIAALALSGCKQKRGSCGEGEVMDERKGVFNSPSYGLCIADKVVMTEEKGEKCWGYEVPTGEKDAEGKPKTKCLTGCTEGNVVDGKCVSNLDMGKSCNLTSDCKDNGVCFQDPQVYSVAVAAQGQATADLAKNTFTYCTKSCLISSDCGENNTCFNPKGDGGYCIFTQPKPDADTTTPDKDEPKPDKDATVTDTDTPAGDADAVTPADTDAPADADAVVPDEGPTQDLSCFAKTCTTSAADCTCDAKVCIPAMASFLVKNAGQCTIRDCDSVNNKGCPEGYVCMDTNKDGTDYSSYLDGAKSICAILAK